MWNSFWGDDMVSVRNSSYISVMQKHIDVFDNSNAWNNHGRYCTLCAKKIQGVSCETPFSRVCILCAEKVYHCFADNQKISFWHHSRFIHVLSGHESLRWRMTILFRYAEAVRISESQKSSDIDGMHRALISNLGCLIDHPLNQTIRQWAVHSVIQIGKPILPILLEYRNKQQPWQLYYNIVLCAGAIGPNDINVQQLLEEAAAHPVEGVRTRTLSIISSQQSVWARNFIERLNKNGNMADMPKVNTATGAQPPPKQGQTVVPEQSKAVVIPAELSPLENTIVEYYPLDKLQTIFARYLASLFLETDFHVKKGAFAVGKLTKRQLVWALGQSFSQKERLEKLLPILPPGVVHLLNRFTWQKEGIRIQDIIKEPLDPPILIQTVEMVHGKSRTVETINPDYAIIPVQKNSSYQYHYYVHATSLFLPDIIRSELKKILLPPERYHLSDTETIEKTDFIYEDNNQILNQIHLICTYITQGNLKYAKTSGKIQKTSIKETTAYCQIHEFYVEKNPELAHLKTSLIIDFLQKQTIAETQTAPVFLKQLVEKFFKDVPRYNDFFLNRLLFHLKGIHNLQGGYHEQSHLKNEKNVRTSLHNLLKELQPGRWYGVERLIDYCCYREMDLDIVNRSFASGYLSIDIRDNTLLYEKYRISQISEDIYREALMVPFFKGFMFLLASFGIVDMAYNYPNNERIRKKEMDYLSVFDGVRYIRLTPLGAYIVGKTKDFSFNDDRECASLALDDKRLLITLDGKDRLKAMVLGQIADKITENCFKVTCSSFLKSCATQDDIKAKISLFNKQVSAKPPRIWEDFLKDILGKIDPLIPEPDLLVFRLKEYPELIELVAMDDILQKIILKAEDYHVIISSQNLNKVKKRLESFGYFNHPLR